MPVPYATPRQQHSWAQDREALKRWFLIHIGVWLGGAALWLAGTVAEIKALATVGPVLFLGSLVPYVVSLVYAYWVQDKLNKASLYKPGAWQVVVGGLFFNPFLLGFAITGSVLSTASRIARDLARQPASASSPKPR